MWERPNWFEPNAAAGAASPIRALGWAGEHWSPAIVAESLACRDTAALFDETSFSKRGCRARRIGRSSNGSCANEMETVSPIGSVIYTQLCNERGGVECDLTATRLRRPGSCS